jgi:Fuc2NAc and GlcNAc transferase
MPLFLFAIFAGSFLITMVVRYFSLKKNIIDIPNERSSHSIPTPRGGGLAIVITWYIGITILFFSQVIEKHLYFALLSGAVLAVISFLDDVIDIKPIIRLICQAVTAIISLYFLGGISSFSLAGSIMLPSIILYPIAFVGFVWFINLYNFLDGIDGYASIEAICIASAFLLFTGNIINALLIACVAGFLIWNWPRAKIFMGDVGSTQLGFIFVTLGIYYHNIQQLSIINWIILTSPFWFDATLTLLRRWRNKEKLSQAHRKHIYQRLVQSGYSHLKVDIFLMVLNSVLIMVTYFLTDNPNLQIVAFVITVMILYLIAFYTDRRKPFALN